jgi:hypothetical protein
MDWHEIARDIARAADGDAPAARALVGALWSQWLGLASASRSLRGAPDASEAAREVATRLAEKLGRPSTAELRSYEGWAAANPDKDAGDWIRILTANAARDVARQISGRAPADAPEPSTKRLFNEFSAFAETEFGVRPPMTAIQTARELLDYAAEVLTNEQLSALTGWLEGASFAQLASDGAHGDEQAVRRALRSGIAVLRRRFAPA